MDPGNDEITMVVVIVNGNGWDSMHRSLSGWGAQGFIVKANLRS